MGERICKPKIYTLTQHRKRFQKILNRCWQDKDFDRYKGYGRPKKNYFRFANGICMFIFMREEDDGHKWIWVQASLENNSPLAKQINGWKTRCRGTEVVRHIQAYYTLISGLREIELRIYQEGIFELAGRY